MHETFEQLARMLSTRGLEWLRQKIMDLPDPCPSDHPDLGALALAGRAAPVFSGLRGRISPLEVIVLRRLSPDLVRSAAQRILAGNRDQVTVNLVLAGSLVAQSDPVWQLACEELADDKTLPLAIRLSLCDDPALRLVAEQALIRPHRHITSGQVVAYTNLLMQIYHYGAIRPRLMDARSFSKIYDNLQDMLDWALEQGCTSTLARVAFCLLLVDPDHDISDTVADLIQVQRADGSFPPRLGFSTDHQDFDTGVLPTLWATLALKMATHRRWKGPALVWLSEQPYRNVAKICADTAEKLLDGQMPRLEDAVALTRATGRDWIG
ncbi:MAG: hypothetical protein L0G27_10310, partial [Paracoccus sp. (in: a-proteobacteria)]|nr:hypothetical protein [Paracoccus sp. (in: a-proteobacteria)]